MIYDYSIFLSFNKKIEMYVDFKENRELFARRRRANSTILKACTIAKVQ